MNQLSLVLLHIKGVVERAVQLLNGDIERPHVAQPAAGSQVLLHLQLNHVPLAIEHKAAMEP